MPVKKNFFTLCLLLTLLFIFPTLAQSENTRPSPQIDIPGAQQPQNIPAEPQEPTPSPFVDKFKRYFFGEDEEKGENDAYGDERDVGGGCSVNEDDIEELMQQYMI